MERLTIFTISTSLLALAGTVLACDSVFDPQTGICHQTSGYQIPGQINGGGQRQPAEYWGALAIDSVNGKTSGSAINRSSKNTAGKDAMLACANDRDCRIAVYFKNSCGAVATNGSTVDAAAYDIKPAVAEQKALAKCNKDSTKPCRIWIPARCAGAGY